MQWCRCVFWCIPWGIFGYRMSPEVNRTFALSVPCPQQPLWGNKDLCLKHISHKSVLLCPGRSGLGKGYVCSVRCRKVLSGCVVAAYTSRMPVSPVLPLDTIGLEMIDVSKPNKYRHQFGEVKFRSSPLPYKLMPVSKQQQEDRY